MNCPYDYDDPEFRLEWFEDRLEKVELERDALWVKTQEDEREINDLRDVNKQLREEIESDNTELDTAWSKVVELQKWKEEALEVMNQWNEVSDYINLNAEVEDLGRFVPQICLKYLKERDEMKKVEEQRDKALLIAHNLKEAIESTFTVSKDSFNADSSYEYIETHGWTHEILKFARGEIKKLEEF